MASNRSGPEAAGLGLLPITTVFVPAKETHQVRARVASGRGLLSGCDGLDLTGYEIHMGRTFGDDGDSDRACAPPFRIGERSGGPVDAPDGVLDREGLTLGTYLHGLFHNHGLRRRLLAYLARRKGAILPAGAIPDLDEEYDKLADSGAQARGHGRGVSHDGARRSGPLLDPARAASCVASMGPDAGSGTRHCAISTDSPSTR